MHEKKLSARLAAMAGFVDMGESLADIGADHGYLPIYLVRKGTSPFAILTDVQPGPLEKTRDSAARAGIEKQDPRIEFRLGDGLSALQDSEVDVVVIAGMGGETIKSILENSPGKAQSFRKYILQPRTKSQALKAWLADAGWVIQNETSAEERGRVCDIIIVVPPEPPQKKCKYVPA